MTIPPREELIHQATEAAMELAEDGVHEAMRKAVDGAVAGREWTGDVDPPTTFALDDALRRVIRQLVENAYRFPQVGDRVRVMERIERFPHFTVPAGELGRVTHAKWEKPPGQLRRLTEFRVRLERWHFDLQEWDNEVYFDDHPEEEVEQALEVLPAQEGTPTAAQAQRLGELLAAGPVHSLELVDAGPGGEGANLQVQSMRQIGENAPRGEVHLIAPDGSVDLQPG